MALILSSFLNIARHSFIYNTELKYLKLLVRFFALLPYQPNPEWDETVKKEWHKSLRQSKFHHLAYKITCWLKLSPPEKMNGQQVFAYETGMLKHEPKNYFPHILLEHFFRSGSAGHIKIVNDKLAFHDFCKSQNVPCPEKMGVYQSGKWSFARQAPWETDADFFIKPIHGSQGKDIWECRKLMPDSYLVHNQNRKISDAFLKDYLEKKLDQKKTYIIQRKFEFVSQNKANIAPPPVIRILTKRGENEEIRIINPILIINPEFYYLSPSLVDKRFFALNHKTGEVVGEINFGTNNESRPPLELTIGEERWQQIVSNTKKLHSHLNTLKYIGWDIALNEKKYSFLEANKSPWLAIHQKYPNLGFQKQFFGLLNK